MTDHHEHFTPDTVDEQIEQLSDTIATPEKRVIATLHRLHQAPIENEQEIIERAWQRAIQSVAQHETLSQPSTTQDNYVIASSPQAEEKAPIDLRRHSSVKKRGSYHRHLSILVAVLVLGLLLASWNVMLNKVRPDLSRQLGTNNTTTQTPPQDVYVGASFAVNKLDARTGKVIWHYNVGSDFRNEMQVVDGVVYIDTTYNGIFALNASSGKLLWHTALPSKPYLPQIANGIYYIATEQGTLYALDTKNGAVKWSKILSKKASPPYAFFLPLVKDNTLYLKTQDGNLQAFDATTGSALWSHHGARVSFQGDFTFSLPSTLTYQDGVIYDASANHLYALSAREGKELWHAQVAPDRFIRGLSLANGNIYASFSPTMGGDLKSFKASYDESRISAFNASTGKLHWTSEKGYNSQLWLWGPAISGNIVFAYPSYSKEAGIYALDANSGKPRWKWNASCIPSEKCGVLPIVVKGNILYLLMVSPSLPKGSSTFLAIDITSGKLLWQSTQAFQPTPFPIPEKDDIIYVFTSGNNNNQIDKDRVRAYSLKTRTVLWTSQLENIPVSSSLAGMMSIILAP